ncbi:hypothetical protein NIES22_24050 [Calothrix brevissima NIES-22]|nr:hypothetical protein NIES22_24050 [Calothrix brevissima NIES-22]
MAKVALLIGISEYEPGLAPLPSAVKDVEAMRRVLLNPEMGGFAEGDITVLKDPPRQDMEDAIYNLYANRQKDDLLLLYFSGHGVKVDNGDFFFSTRYTRKNQGKLIPTSAVAARTVHSLMNESKSKRLVVILDCCFSGAFAKDLTAKDGGNIDLQQHLGGEGRAILTASTSMQYAFQSDGLELSIYTHYLVEGIEKGAADVDGDGWIAVDELHKYAKSKVQEAVPAMTPEFYPIKEGYRIFLAKSPKDDPRLKYRKEVERRLNRGKFTTPARRLLNSLRVQWKLDTEIADAIEAEVLQPYREYERKLAEYKETLVETIKDEPALSETTFNDLRDYQQHLGLRDEDVAPIEELILGKSKNPTQKTTNQLDLEIVKVHSQGSAEFFTESLGNGVVLEMVAIPGGKFLMGSPENEPERLDWERPLHNVTIQPFFMGKFPVTQSQWQAVAALDKVNIDLNPDPSNFKGANRPVERVSWDDAIEFCARLSKKTGETYRLPSEAEWEYACRGGTTTPFYFGETITTDLANYNGNYTYGSGTKGEYREQTTDVGKFPANPFGLFDMCGNVWEWCQDEWHDNYNNAPTDASTLLVGDDENNKNRLLRGGSWNYAPRDCRSASRNYYARGGWDNRVGFRVVVVRRWT